LTIFGKKLHWIDVAITLIIVALVLFVWQQIGSNLNYKWRWHLIPNFIAYWNEDTQSWVANLYLEGLFATIRICIMAGALALVLGFILGVARCSNNLTIRMLARTYVELLRNVPPLVIIFVFYFFLSEQIIVALNVEDWSRSIARSESSGIWELFFGDMRSFPALLSGVIVLGMFESAFVGEIVRAGIQSIPKGQTEAAESIGLSSVGKLRFIIFPQATRKVAAPLANQFISLVKDSAIISLISVQELSFVTFDIVVSTNAIFEPWITTALLYFTICFGLSLLFRRLE
jgi:polar amino acid transport system permease protein|tara:strand:- start:4510 stop:5373 length:864 start_codon:yes stop_codon:yes gene_type:complete